jgi:glycosyltransferase involved in cell wall biosynthesis
MKVLLLTNIVPPQISGIIGRKKVVTGGWLHSIVDYLSKQPKMEIGICVPDGRTEVLVSGAINGLTYYFYPEKNSSEYLLQTDKIFSEILNDFNPDIINIFGTEYPRTLSMINSAHNAKVVITMTGIISIYANHYFGRVPIRMQLPNWRLIFKLGKKFMNIPTLWDGRKEFIKRGRYEIEAINKAKYIIGRTRFDKAFVLNENPDIKYFHCNESLRNPFYNNDWSFEKCIKHSIFLPQAGYPIKGFEVFLEGLKILKRKYQDVKVFIPGVSVFALKNSIKSKIKIIASDYDSYIKKLVDRYGLWENITFVGLLDEEEMMMTMKKCNVFVLPSAVENSPNTLGEAMLLGMPCVSACVGGVQDLMSDSKEGFLYPYDEPHIMAYQISTIFDDADTAKRLGNNAKKRASVTHNLENNMRQLIDIYTKVLEENEVE